MKPEAVGKESPDGNGLSIRQAGASDLPRIVEFNARMAEETEGILLSPGTLTAGVQSVLDDPRRGFYLIAEEDVPIQSHGELAALLESDGTITPVGSPSKPPTGRRAIGQLMITYEWSDWRCGDFWWIQSVFVRPEYRGRGVFRALFDEVLTEARRRVDVVGLRLYAATGNSRAQEVYRKLGMNGDRYLVFEMEKDDVET